MKELDLMHAINDLDNGILLEAEQLERKPRRRVLSRIAAVAAVFVLLCGTAYAVSQSVRAAFTGETWVAHHEELREDMLYSDLEVNYDLAPVEVSADAMDFMEDYLADHWAVSLSKDPIGWVTVDRSFLAGSHWWEEDGEYLRPEGLESRYFTSFEEVEEFLGLSLDVPELARMAEPANVSAADEPGILLNVLTPPLVEDGDVMEYLDANGDGEATAKIVPGYAQLSFRVPNLTGDFSGVSGNVIIALTEEAAEQDFTSYLSVALDYLSEPEFRELEIDGLDGTLLVFAPCGTDDGAVHAFYTCGGVGYIIHAYLATGVETEDPAELLLPWLEELG